MNIDWQVILVDGLIISVVGYVIVFIALVILYLVFTYLARGLNLYIRKRLERQGRKFESADEIGMIPADVAAAITMAIYLSTELHDEESNILTIKRKSGTYTPWSSKIYSVRSQIR
jgi:hypothetical protein